MYVRSTVTGLVIRVAYVVDADPEGEQRIGTSPRRACRLASRTSQEFVHLVRKG